MTSEETRTGDLRRAIRLPHATAMVVGTIIGASIFLQPSEITGQVPSLPGATLVWVLAGALTFLGARVTAELAARLPDSGGVYAYLRDTIHPMLGFLWGWAMFWTMHSGILAAIAVVFSRYLAYFVPMGDAGGRAAAISVILALSWVNVRGVYGASLLQTAFTVVKVLAIVLMVAIGFALGGGGGASGEAALVGGGAAGGAGGVGIVAGGGLLGGAGPLEVLLAVAAGLFAFGGWHMVTYAAEETVAPERTLPRALTLGVAIVTVCYVLLNAVYFYVLPLETVISSDRVAADAADAVVGYGGAVMSGLVVFSTFGALAGIVLAGPRVYYAMARDGLLFRWLGGLHPTRGTPHRAIVLQALWASALVWTESYRALFTRVIYTEWIFFAVMALGLLALRSRSRGEGDPGRALPVTPLWMILLFAGAALLVVLAEVVAAPVASATGLGFVAAGVPVYLIWVRSSRHRPETP